MKTIRIGRVKFGFIWDMFSYYFNLRLGYVFIFPNKVKMNTMYMFWWGPIWMSLKRKG